MQRILSLTVSVIALMFVVSAITGYIVGPEHSFEEEIVLDYSVNEVWGVLTEVQDIENGKKDIDYVEVVGKYLNFYVWIEHLNDGGFRRYRQIEKVDRERLVIELVESSYEVTGTWEFDIYEQDNKTVVKITENSKYDSVIGRGFQYYFGLDKETRDWLKLIRVRLFSRLLTTP